MGTNDTGGTMSFSLQLTGMWNKVDAMLDPRKWQKALDMELDRATRVNAQYYVRIVRARIKSKKYAPPAYRTGILKGDMNSTPLIDHGDLFKAITWNKISKGTYLGGVLRTAVASDGYSLFNLAQELHEGIAIKVTPKMWYMFQALHQYSTGQLPASELRGRAAVLARRMAVGQEFNALPTWARYIRIPARPFLREPFEEPQMKARFIKNWREGVERAITRISKS
jgi:hypothetical protein